LHVDEGGSVTQAKTVCGGPPLLLDPALQAARGAKFTPTIINGKPKQVNGIVTYNFIRY
jgi:outer membrane biosynthesis protein TonB